MKIGFLLATLFVSFQLLATQIVHDVMPGSLHKGGKLVITVTEERQNDFDAVIDYEIKPKPLVPVSDRIKKGQFVATMPIEFLSEVGYQTLAEGGPIVNQGATIEHLGFEDIFEFKETHHVLLTPESKKWLLEAWYSPEIESTGWAQLAIEIQDVPIVGKYKVYSRLKK